MRMRVTAKVLEDVALMLAALGPQVVAALPPQLWCSRTLWSLA